MLKAIEFKSDRFNQEDEMNYIDNLTKNSIILCNSTSIKRELVKEIQNTLNEQAEYNDYYCDDEDIRNYNVLIDFLTTTVIQIGEQTIVFSVEPTCIFKANNIEDIWFCDEINNKIELYPMEVFKGSYDKWDEGIIEVYKYICSGRYGTYDGNYLK